ncbi:MAG: MarR family transcriptional regulator [Candidatus Dormibacteria bacterium]
MPSPTAPAPAPPASELAARLPGVLQRLNRRLREVSGPLGIAPGHYPVLVSLLERRAATVSELAAQERMRVPSMTAVLMQLETAGLVRKRVDVRDRRFVQVSLTAKGAAVARAATRFRAQWLGERLAHLSGSEVGHLARALPVLEHLVGLER